MKVFEEKRIPEQWKIARILHYTKRGIKKKLGTIGQSAICARCPKTMKDKD